MAQIIDQGPGASGKRWTVRYREPGGRTARQREKSLDRKKDAVDFATKVENDKRENIYVDPSAGKVSLRSYASDWLAQKTASAGTLESYERILRLHIVPHLGRKMISQVTAGDIEGLYTRWHREGAALNTIESRHIVLSALFSHAARHRQISGNPVKQAEKLENPVIPVDDRSLPSFDEIAALAYEIGPRLSPAIWLMACCGLRIGESLGVFHEDVRGGTLRIRRQVIRYKGADGKYTPRYAPLKHRKEGEWRDIPVPNSLQPFIGGLPVHNASGGLPYPDLLRKFWDRAIKRLGLPEYNPHDLRHKWATVTLTSGVSIHEVSRWLGHRSIKVTVDKYGHLTQDGRERCRQVVEAAVAPHMLTAGRTPSEPGADLVLA
ncbi:site-specific integrase [Streptomyces sp. NBC_00257]|uniref:tyrosine-type recombinase/integrase n=1 Tax=unclassified Streptomyces TaxID=2593676 RepID=UPI002256981E|nr:MULTISPECIES: site-specific integrase [unclassified Streptomyces]MCX5426883.1 site-specific integrase [Streptomyces sp. NBC_00062]